MKPVTRVLALAAIALGSLALAAPATAAKTAPADVSDFEFASFDGEYFLDIDENGYATTRVIETIVAVFPEIDQNRGIIRALPLTYDEIPLNVAMLSVTDEDGEAVYFERNDYGGFAEFALGTDEFVHGPTTYVLEYTMRNTILHFGDSGGDEFYWDINGDGWRQSFGSVTATVHVSDALAAALTGDAACYYDYLGEECDVVRDGSTFTAEAIDVGPYTTLTIAIGFEGGTVVQGQAPRDSWIVQLAPKLLLGMAGLLLLAAIIYRIVAWRDHPGRGTIIAEYSPPEDSNLLIDSNIVQRSMPGLSAQFVDLAVRGIVQVIDNDPQSSNPRAKDRYGLKFLTKDGANREELRVLVALFGVSLSPGKVVIPGRLPAATGDALYRLAASAAVDVTQEGLRTLPDPSVAKVLTRIGWWILPVFIPIWVWAGLHDILEAAVIGPSFGALGIAIAVPIVLSRPRLLTEKGALLRDHLLGIREYLTIAEEQRMRVLQSPEGALRVNTADRHAIVKLNERLLPYAVLWGVEDQWAQKLQADYEGAAPEWFASTTFDSSMLSGFTSVATSAARPIVTSSSGGSSWSSSSSSSSSSGSSGGGSSGGGGGGGGGGGR